MRIRVATLNVWALPGPFAEEVGRRMQAIGRRLPELGVDVIAFQEVWTADAREHLLRSGRAAGLEHVWHKHAALGGSGLLVLSRLPIEHKRFDKFALRGYPERIDHADYYGGKGFVQMSLATPAGSLTLMDTHLHAPYSNDVSHEYRAHRAAQVVELALAARETRGPVIAVGDFNFEETQPEYRLLTGLSGFRDVAAELDRREPTVWRGNAFRHDRHPGKRIDYVFARDGGRRALAPHRVERVFDHPIELPGRPGSYSDHAGVLAELEIRPGLASTPIPDREALALARRMLREGRAQAKRRRDDLRHLAGAGFGTAVVAAAGMRTRPITRRRLLRVSLQGLGLAALTPALGFSMLSELAATHEMRAFDALASRLARLEPPGAGADSLA